MSSTPMGKQRRLSAPNHRSAEGRDRLESPRLAANLAIEVRLFTGLAGHRQCTATVQEPSRQNGGLCMRLALAAVVALLLAVCPLARGQTGTAVEYYYAEWNYYFVTSFPDEIAYLDGGAFGGVWQRTGQTFNVWTGPTGGALPTCRFFSTNFAPKSSHFYTPHTAECAALKSNAAWQYEAIAFHLALPGVGGNCPIGRTPIYRFYNNGATGAPNHRYTTDTLVVKSMTAQGWTQEGDRTTGVFACGHASEVPSVL